MNKFQAMALAMTLFSKDEIKPQSGEYRTLRQLIAFKIDRLGPEAALEQIRNNKEGLLNQVRYMMF